MQKPHIHVSLIGSAGADLLSALSTSSRKSAPLQKLQIERPYKQHMPPYDDYYPESDTAYYRDLMRVLLVLESEEFRT